jgi:hypothetical protein
MALVLTLCISSTVFIRKEAKHLIDDLQYSAEMLDKGNKDEAYKTIDHAEKEWHRLEFITDMLMKSNVTLEINASFAKLKPYLEKDNAEFFAETEYCRELLQTTLEKS